MDCLLLYVPLLTIMTESLTYLLWALLLLALVVIILLYVSNYKLRKQVRRLEIRSKKDEELKSNFLTHIGQALRTPVTVINEYCQTIQNKGCENLTDAERKEVLSNIHKNSLQMFTYLNELQELTNFNGATPALSMIEVNIAELIMSYRREILHDTQRGVTVCIRTSMSPHCKATLDTTMFRQLIMSLLRLGAQRTKEGEITIEYEWDNEGLRFNLSDSGDPVPDELRELLFTNLLKEEHITHLDNRMTVNSLNICKSIIDSMQGTIQAMPGKNGRGIVVSFWVPCYVRFN